jgi:ABC-type Fe3+ transport system permease subunit
MLLPPALAAAVWLGLRLPWPGAVGCGAILAATYWPVVALLVRAALSRIPASEVDAAELHLESGTTLRRVVWPRLRPTVAVSALLVFLLAAAEFSVPSTFTVTTIGFVVFERLSALQAGAAAAAGGPLALLAVGAALAISRVPLLPQSRGSRPFLGGRVLRAVRGVALLAWLLTAALPAAVFAVTAASPLRAVQAHADWFLWSFGTSAAAAAGLVVWSAVTPGRSALEGGWLASLALPAVVPAIGALVAANRLGVQGPLVETGVLLVLCLMARYAWVAWTPLREPVERGPLEAAELAGLSRWATWRRIVLPAILPRSLAAGAIVMALSLAEVGPSVLVSPPGGQTVVLHLFNLIHAGYDDTVAALSLVMLAAAGILAWTGCHVGRLHRA